MSAPCAQKKQKLVRLCLRDICYPNKQLFEFKESKLLLELDSQWSRHSLIYNRRFATSFVENIPYCSELVFPSASQGLSVGGERILRWPLTSDFRSGSNEVFTLLFTKYQYVCDLQKNSFTSDCRLSNTNTESVAYWSTNVHLFIGPFMHTFCFWAASGSRLSALKYLPSFYPIVL